MKSAFLDTAGLLALWDTDDQWHAAADTVFSELCRGKIRLLTTSFVLLECANAAARRPFRQAVARLRERMETTTMLIFPTEQDWRQAWTEYASSATGQPGVVDCVSFAVMRRLGIRQAFTNDRHFHEAGFETLF
jgi:uncharacterized protein